MTATKSSPAPEALQQWQQWRSDRASELNVPFGWLSLTDLVWLDDTKISVPQLPGRWWATNDAIIVEPTIGAAPQITEVAEGESLTGVTLEDGSRVEFLARSGHRGLRIRSTINRPLGEDGLVPTAPYDTAWIKKATIAWFDQPRPVIVGSAQPGLQHHTAVTGTVTFTHEDAQHQLFVTGTGTAATVTYADASSRTAAWRLLPLKIDPVDPGTILLDFNFSQNYPSAFSRYGTCPAPTAGNTLPFAVPAGELLP